MTDPVAVPASIRAELVELKAERSVLLGERERLLSRLRAAEIEAEQSVRAQEAMAEQLKFLDEMREQLDQASEARVELDALRRERDLAREEVARTRGERDHLRMSLLRAELADRGHVERPAGGDAAEIATLRDQLAEFAAHAAHLQQELDAHRATVSWRVTAPLRNVRRRQTGR